MTKVSLFISNTICSATIMSGGKVKTSKEYKAGSTFTFGDIASLVADAAKGFVSLNQVEITVDSHPNQKLVEDQILRLKDMLSVEIGLHNRNNKTGLRLV